MFFPCSRSFRPPAVVRRGWRLALTMFLAALAAGCGGENGPPRVAVNGTVSLDGAPLAAGQIRFIPTGQTRGPAAAGTIANGAYELSESDGPVVGAHRVEIEATGYQGFAIDDEAAFVEQVEKNRSPALRNPVPEIYNRRSTLTANVSPEGPHTFNFQLSSQGGQTTSR